MSGLLHKKDDLNNMEAKLNPEKPLMINGFGSIRQQMRGKHPLEALERTREERIDNSNYGLLKSVQGIHAPLRLMYERRAAEHIGRLPFMASSNIMLDVLTGKDETIDFDDFLNDRNESELLSSPHMTVEKQLRLL